MNKTQARILAEKVVKAVFEEFDLNGEWIIGEDYAIRKVQKLLLDPKSKLR